MAQKLETDYTLMKNGLLFFKLHVNIIQRVLSTHPVKMTKKQMSLITGQLKQQIWSLVQTGFFKEDWPTPETCPSARALFSLRPCVAHESGR